MMITNQDDYAADSSTESLLVVGDSNQGVVEAEYDSSSAGAYGLFANIADDYSADPNTAGSLVVDVPSEGVIEQPFDHDWFRIFLDAGSLYGFSIKSDTIPDPSLTLVVDASTPLEDIPFSRAAVDEFIYRPTSSAYYYLDAGALSASTGAYTLEAALLDDFADDGSTQATLSLGLPMAAEIESAGDHDWFKIQLTAGVSYSFHLSGESLPSATLSLRDSEAQEIASNENALAGDIDLSFTPLSTGTYFIDAGALDGDRGTYHIVASYVDDYPADSSTEGYVSIDTSATGIVEIAYERDWFQVFLEAGISYRFNLNGITLEDPTLYLRDADGTQLAYNDDSSGLDSQFFHVPLDSGVYYLDAGGFRSHTGSYSLLISYADDQGADPSTGGSLTAGETISSSIGHPADRDWYRISLNADEEYTFTLSPIALGDTILALRDSSGNELVLSDDAQSPDSQITYIPSQSGTFFLDVGAPDGLTGGYRLASTVRDDIPSDFSTSASVDVGGTAEGSIEVSFDRDWFRILLEEGVTYRFNLNSITIGDPTLYLRDSTGASLAFNDDSSGLDSQIIYTVTSSGLYYLDAGGYSNRSGSYLLTTSWHDDVVADSSSATTLSIGGLGITSNVDYLNDRDWFRVSLDAGTGYVFTLSANTILDTSMLLRDATGTVIASNDDPSSPDSQIAFNPTQSGVYYLDAGGPESALGAYTLRAMSVILDDFSGNRTSTGLLPIDQSASGRIETSFDHDWFLVMLEAGRTYRFTVDSTSNGDPTLHLRNSLGETLRYNDNFNGLNSEISYASSVQDVFWLDVGGYGGSAGSYIVLAETLLDDDYASDNSTAGFLEVGSVSTGVLETETDHDCLRVALRASTPYRFNLSSDSINQTTLDLLDLYGNVLVSSTGHEFSGSEFVYTPFADGDFFLNVGALGAATGSFLIAAAEIQNDDYAGDASSTALLSLGGLASGIVESRADRDWFQVALLAGESYHFTLAAVDPIEPTLTLRDASGVLLATAEGRSDSSTEFTYTAPQSGTFYLDAGASGGRTGAYSLSASPLLVEVAVGQVTVTTSPPDGSFSADATLSQQDDQRNLLAIGVDASRLDMGGREEFADNTVAIRSSVTASSVVADAVSLNGSTLQLRPGNDVLLIEATRVGVGSGSTIAVRDSLVSGNRGDDTLTFRGDYWGDRALIFGGDGNDIITGYGIGRDSFLQAGSGDDVVSLGRFETSATAAPLQRANGNAVDPSTYRGGDGFDVLQLRETTEAEFYAQATLFSNSTDRGWLFQGARFSGFERIQFG